MGCTESGEGYESLLVPLLSTAKIPISDGRTRRIEALDRDAYYRDYSAPTAPDIPTQLISQTIIEQ